MDIYTLLKSTACGLIGLLLSSATYASDEKTPKLRKSKQQVVEHWTAERMQLATPRDLVIDEQGKPYLKGRNGQLTPYGLSNDMPTTKARPSEDSDDITPPDIELLSPGNDTEIGAIQTFEAKITDSQSGVRSATVIITLPSGLTESFSATNQGNDIWSVSLQGFTDGEGWKWKVEARDNARGRGNSDTSEEFTFSVNTNGSNDPIDPDPGDTPVANASWENGGDIQLAAGRIYFEMPDRSNRRRWSGYVCSGTVANDETENRSVIITAAHCVYDDANKAFARNVLFIPNQAATTGTGTDLNCTNDPLGCWVPSLGIVDADWASRTFPSNIPWDYAYYVVDDSDYHAPGFDVSSESATLDAEVTPYSILFSNTSANGTLIDVKTYGLGYSYSDDPNFMYCADILSIETSYQDWWLDICGLSGGSSGGPWVQGDALSTDPIISVNSWGYTNSPGMAGPRLHDNSASCLFDNAKLAAFDDSLADGDAGVIVDFSNGCTTPAN